MVSSGCSHSDKRHLCGGCAQVSYCSAECATRHWEDVHQWECIAGKREAETPEEEEFMSAMKMLKGDEQVQIFHVHESPVDKWLKVLDVNEASYNELKEFMKMLDNDRRVDWFREAFRRYFDDPRVTISSKAIQFAMYIKKMESVLDRKTLTLTGVVREFYITKSFARTKLQLHLLADKKGAGFEIPIKLVWLRLLQHYAYDFEKVMNTLKQNKQDVERRQILTDRVLRIKDAIKFWIVPEFNLYDLWTDARFVELAKDYPIHQEIYKFLQDETFIGPDPTDMLQYLRNTLSRLMFYKYPEFLLDHIRAEYYTAILKVRRNELDTRINETWAGIDPRTIDAYLKSVDNGDYFTDPTKVMTRDQLEKIYAELYEMIAKDHPSWVYLRGRV